MQDFDIGCTPPFLTVVMGNVLLVFIYSNTMTIGYVVISKSYIPRVLKYVRYTLRMLVGKVYPTYFKA